MGRKVDKSDIHWYIGSDGFLRTFGSIVLADWADDTEQGVPDSSKAGKKHAGT
jgi:hypothetical protein